LIVEVDTPLRCRTTASTQGDVVVLLIGMMLTASPRTYYVVQYWESKEKLYAYAHSPEMFHHRAGSM
jgi:hypothetical protein